MAEAPYNQDRIRSARPVNSITSLENNVAELIAQDMRQLELEDAEEKARTIVEIIKDDKRPGSLADRTDPVSSSWRNRLNMDEGTGETAAGSSRDREERNENTSETHRPSWRDRFSRDENINETSERPSRDRISMIESSNLTTTGLCRDRLSREENTHETSARPSRDEDTPDNSASQRAGQNTGESPQEYVAGSYRRGSWRERLYGVGTTYEASAPLGDRSIKDESPQEHVPGSYRRGSWRERLNRDENTSSRPWRDRLNKAENTPDAANDSQRGRQDTDDSTQDYVAGSYRRGSWRERLRTEDNEIMESRNSSGQESNSLQSNGSAAERDSLVNDVQRENNAGNVPNMDDEANIENNAQIHEASSDHAGAESENTSAENEVKKEEIKAWTAEDVLKLLVKAINYRTPLKDLETILRWELDVNLPHKNGLRALHYAAYTNYVSCVELLLNKGANINITDDIGYTPLHLAARCGHYKTMEKLIENGAMLTFNEPGVEIRGLDEVNKLGFTNTEPVNLAIQNCHPQCAELLLKNGARADNKYFMGYEISLAPMDDITCIEVLLKYGASPNVFNRCGLSPLMKACKDHRIDVVRLLLQHGADYNAQCPPLFEQKSVLQIAIESGNIVIINLLLFKNPKISRHHNYSYSALHTAIIKGRADICRLLLQKGANPEERTEAGATPLMMACSTLAVKERKEIVQMLLDCGADVNAYGENFSYVDPYLSPIAEYFKNIGSAESFNIVECLIFHGARIHYTSGDVLLGGRRDPFAIVSFAHSMVNSPEIFDLTMQAAQRYNPLAIHACDSLPEDMKNTLLMVATQPGNLKQIVRMAIRHILLPDIFDDVMELPLPELLKSYLLFK